jgi:hypothetical protein
MANKRVGGIGKTSMMKDKASQRVKTSTSLGRSQAMSSAGAKVNPVRGNSRTGSAYSQANSVKKAIPQHRLKSK